MAVRCAQECHPVGCIATYVELVMEFEFKYLGEWLCLAIQSCRGIWIKIGGIGKVVAQMVQLFINRTNLVMETYREPCVEMKTEVMVGCTQPP